MPCKRQDHGLALLAYIRSDRRNVPFGEDFLLCPACGETLYDERDRAGGIASPFVDDLKRARATMIEASAELARLPVRRSALEQRLSLGLLIRTEALKLDDTLAVRGHGAVLPVVGYLAPPHQI